MRYTFTQKKLMAPGPVPLPKYVEDIFACGNAHHRTKDFSQVLISTLKKLKTVFQTDEHVFFLPATGTGAMEAGLVNTLSPGDKVIIVEAGKFGERWKKMALRFGLEVDLISVPWGHAVAPQQIQERLCDRTKAILIQACETSTGVAHPIEALGRLVAETSTLLIVDGITALAAYSVPMDQWGVDVLVGGSQKGFMLPTGVSFLALSVKAQEASKDSKYLKYYWDLEGEKLANAQGKTRYSTPVQFTLALHSVLEDILETQGLKKHFLTIEKRAQVFRKRVELPLFSASPSPSLSCLRVPEHLDAVEIKKVLSGRDGISIVAGQDQIKNKVLRVGHMGAMTFADLEQTADAINRCL